MYLQKDFIQTQEGLYFAIVSAHLENQQVLCCLRYLKNKNQWQKFSTETGNAYLKEFYPQYLYYSQRLDVHLHAVPISQIVQHYQPRQRLQFLLQSTTNDPVIVDLQQLCRLFMKNKLALTQIGITGSILIGAQNSHSDVDLVFYDKTLFHQTRELIAQFINHGECQNLSIQDWQDAFARRNCELTLNEYIWHEQRKLNKALINQRKFDLSWLGNATESTETYQKLGAIQLTAHIKNDSAAFDYPAEYLLEHSTIHSVVSFTATYSGQARTGELVEVVGQLEKSSNGVLRIIIGSNREAHGEYLKVLT